MKLPVKTFKAHPENFTRNKQIFIFCLFVVSVFIVPEVYAAPNLNFLEKSLIAKINQIAKVVGNVAKACAGLGVTWFIFSFFRGEPNWRYGVWLTIGGSLFFAGSLVAEWCTS